jgi:hypothetical protein
VPRAGQDRSPAWIMGLVTTPGPSVTRNSIRSAGLTLTLSIPRDEIASASPDVVTNRIEQQFGR